jgi:hypothetical protein
MLSSLSRINILVPEGRMHGCPATDEQIIGVWQSWYRVGRVPDMNVLRRGACSRWCRNSIQLFRREGGTRKRTLSSFFTTIIVCE